MEKIREYLAVKIVTKILRSRLRAGVAPLRKKCIPTSNIVENDQINKVNL